MVKPYLAKSDSGTEHSLQPSHRLVNTANEVHTIVRQMKSPHQNFKFKNGAL
jgi:hypothetical protein